MLPVNIWLKNKIQISSLKMSPDTEVSIENGITTQLKKGYDMNSVN